MSALAETSHSVTKKHLFCSTNGTLGDHDSPISEKSPTVGPMAKREFNQVREHGPISQSSAHMTQ